VARRTAHFSALQISESSHSRSPDTVLPLFPSSTSAPIVTAQRPIDAQDSFRLHLPHVVPASQARTSTLKEAVASTKNTCGPRDQLFQQPLVADRGEMQHLWDVKATSICISSAASDCLRGALQPENQQQSERAGQPAAAHFTLYPTDHIWRGGKDWLRLHLERAAEFAFQFRHEANEAHPAGAHVHRHFRPWSRCAPSSGGASLANSCHCARALAQAGAITRECRSCVEIPTVIAARLHLKYPDCKWPCAGDGENLIPNRHQRQHPRPFIADPQVVVGFITRRRIVKIVFILVTKYGRAVYADEVQTRLGPHRKKWFGIEQLEVIPT